MINKIMNILISILGLLLSVVCFILQSILSSVSVVFFILIKFTEKVVGILLIFTSILFFVAIVLMIFDIRQVMSGTVEFMHTKYYSVVIVFSCMHFSVFALAKIIDVIQKKMIRQ